MTEKHLVSFLILCLTPNIFCYIVGSCFFLRTVAPPIADSNVFLRQEGLTE